MRLDGVRARHEAGGYGKADLEILLLGTRAQWAREHPPPRVEADTASASPRPMHNEGDSGNVVGDGNTGVRGVIRAADVGVGGVPAQVLRRLRLEATRTATPMVGINLLYGVESGRLQRLMRRLDDGGEMLLVSSAGDVVARARYSGRVLYTDLRPCSTKLTTTSMEVVALRTIVSATKSTPDKWHARLAHVGVDTIKSSAKHEIAASLDIKKPTADDLPCASCVGGKLAWHTFPVQGSDAENALDVVHIDLCGPFRVAANDGSFYFLLLKDRKTRYVWGNAVKVAMDEEISSLISNGTWELAERPRSVNIMKNHWVLMTKYHVDDTVAREKARLVGKGFTQVYDADYDETPLLWYKALNDVLTGTGWKKSQVDEALYLKVGNDEVACWVLVYVNDLLDASSSTAVLKELKELLEAAFELREISPVEKYLGLEIVCDRPAWKLWLHQQVYVDKLRRRFINEEQTGRVPKTLVSIDAYAELMFDKEEFQSREEEEHRQKIRSLQFAVTTTRLDIAFACSKLGSGLTVRSDNHWREVGHCLLYLADTCDATLELGSGPETLDLVSYADADDTGDK
ncbi:unnamed protein product [Closterium sp. NIES-53]